METIVLSPQLLPVALVTAANLLAYQLFIMLTGRARSTCQVPAPATQGHPLFERIYRVQQNTLEQLMITLPAMWLFAFTLHAYLAALLGAVFLVSRVLYYRGYVLTPRKRMIGFVLGTFANSILLLGALVGPLLKLID